MKMSSSHETKDADCTRRDEVSYESDHSAIEIYRERIVGGKTIISPALEQDTTAGATTTKAKAAQARRATGLRTAFLRMQGEEVALTSNTSAGRPYHHHQHPTEDPTESETEELEVSDSEETPLAANVAAYFALRESVVDLSQQYAPTAASTSRSNQPLEQLEEETETEFASLPMAATLISSSTQRVFPVSQKAMRMILQSHQEALAAKDKGNPSVVGEAEDVQAVSPEVPRGDEEAETSNEKIQEESHPLSLNRVVSCDVQSQQSCSSAMVDNEEDEDNNLKKTDISISSLPWWQVILCILLLLFLWNLDAQNQQPASEL